MPGILKQEGSRIESYLTLTTRWQRAAVRVRELKGCAVVDCDAVRHILKEFAELREETQTALLGGLRDAA